MELETSMHIENRQQSPIKLVQFYSRAKRYIGKGGEKRITDPKTIAMLQSYDY